VQANFYLVVDNNARQRKKHPQADPCNFWQLHNVAARPENYKFAFEQSTHLTNGLSGKTNWRETAYSGVAATRLADGRAGGWCGFGNALYQG
jgi:hypothetical protein